MSNEHAEDNKSKGTSDSTAKPDPDTLHTTDPQEHMEGPLSSLMQKTADGFDNKKTADDEEEPAREE